MAVHLMRQGLERNEKILVCIWSDAERALPFDYSGILIAELQYSPSRIRKQVIVVSHCPECEQSDQMIRLMLYEAKASILEGFDSLRIISVVNEGFSGLNGSRCLIDHVMSLNQAMNDIPCALFCLFDIRRVSPVILMDILCVHPQVLIGSEPVDNFYYLPPQKFLGPDPQMMKFASCLNNLTRYQQLGSALKESEKRFQDVLSNITALVCRFLPDGTLTYVNRAYSAYFQKKPSELIGENFFKFIPGDSSDAVKKHYQSLSVQEPVVTYEHKVIASDSEVRWQQWTDIALFDLTGRIIEYLSIGHDISQRKLAEESLEKSQAQLIQAQKMEALGSLVAGVAHEINNPINLIMFNSPLIERVWKDIAPVFSNYAEKYPDNRYGGLPCDFIRSNLGQMLSDMTLAANRVAKIVKGLKDFAKQSSVCDRKPVSVNMAVENAMRLSQVSLKKSGVALVLNLAEELPDIHGDLQGIEQVVLNLLINAVEAIDHDSGIINVSTGILNPGNRIYIRVADNGKGVNPSLGDKIFDPFVTDKHDSGGSGLGLSVSFSLIKAHDGQMSFSPRKGGGTEFQVVLPVMLKKELPRVLVVDDDDMIRAVVRKTLANSCRYLVDEAANGYEACIRLGACRPDLLILDIFMPEMDGVEVCRVIRGESGLSDMKVLITTGFPDHPRITKIRELGFVDICYKPFSVEQLVRTVDDLLAGSRVS